MDSKPTTITAQEFIDNNYATKIVLGECKVTDVSPMGTVEVGCIYSVDNILKVVYVAAPNDQWGINAKTVLHVEWLPPQASEPAPATAAGEFATVEGLTMLTREDGSKSFYRPHRGYVEVFYDTLDTVRPLQAELAALRADNARLQAELAAAKGALKPFARTYQTWIERPNLDTSFKDWLKGHLSANRSAFTNHARAWFEQAAVVFDDTETKP